MYIEYFGLRKKPFTIAPDPRYLYMSEHHREALAHLLYGINSDGCLILLTGDVGTGKTTVCRSLLEQLPEDTDAAIIVNPKLTVDELLESICEEFTIPIEKNSGSTKSYIDGLNNYLLNSHGQGRATVLIIDEAQNLDMDVLEQLRLLTNLETDTHKLLKIVLIGQPELQDKLENPDVAQINQRITSRYHLSPLNEEDTCGFIQYRLIIAGGGRMQFFSQNALHVIFQQSCGIPRLINMICDRALLGAFVEGVDQVNDTIASKAAAEVLGTVFVEQQNTVVKKHRPNIKMTIVSTIIICLSATLLLLITKPSALTSIRQTFNDFFRTEKETTITQPMQQKETKNAESQLNSG